MPDYQLSKVYQIVCLTTGQKYVGSTTQKTLAERLAGHRANYNRWKRGTYHFVSSFSIIEQDNYQIELLETFPCNSKDELNAREGHHIRYIDCVNKRIEGRTKQEWREANKTELTEKSKAYYDTNKTVIKEKGKAYYEANKIAVLDRNKIYQEINKETINKRKREKYQYKKNEILT